MKVEGAQSRSGFLLAHLSDPHLPTTLGAAHGALFSKRLFGYLHWRLRRARIHRTKVLDALCCDLITIAPDHVAVTGDIVNISLPTEFARTGGWLRSLGSPANVTVVPGNHDAYVAVSWQRSWAAWQEFMTSDEPDHGAPALPDHDRFPLLRLRGPLAILGLSTAVPTPPGHASGTIGRDQLARLASCMASLAGPRWFRVVLLHHPPLGGAPRHKSLTDADAFRSVIAETGAELILHGHEHQFRYGEISGPLGPVPVFGVPSASVLPGRSDAADGEYHLHRIEPRREGWLLETRMRTYSAALGRFVERDRRELTLPCGVSISAALPPAATTAL